ncbi:MAG: hypothetical protein MJ229_02450 [bacterium]|nr:hypothetical protein [bacterium]
MSGKLCLKLCLIILILAILGGVIAGVVHNKAKLTHKNNLYQQAQIDINSKNWAEARDKLAIIGKYKDSENMTKIANYNYYLELGDKNLQKKEYYFALHYYKKAEENTNNNELLNNKIKNTKIILEKINAKKDKKRTELERKQKIKEQKERKQQLADIQPAINKTFYKIDFTDYGTYDFYVDPYLWAELPFDVKENAFKLAVLYAKLKTNEEHSNNQYLVSTKIKSSSNKSILAEYTIFSGIKIK